MRKLNRRILAGLACLAMTTSLAACTGGGGSKNTAPEDIKSQEIAGEISFQTWSLKNEKFTPYFEKLIKDFEAKYPKVKIKWLDQPGPGYEEKLLQQANSTEMPDVVNLPPEYGLPLAKAGKLLDLSKADPKTLETYVKGGVDAYKYTGVQGSFGFPWYLGSAFNYWNTDALTKAGIDPKALPKSEEEFQKVAKEAAGKGVALVAQVPDVGFLASRGVKVWDEKEHKFVFNSPEAVALLEKYTELYKAGGIVPETLTKPDDGNILNQAFYSSAMGRISSTPSFADSIRKDAPSLLDKVTVTAPWEKPQLLVQGLAVSSTSKAPAAALAFAEYVTNTANQVAFVKIAKGFMPGTIEGNSNPANLAAPNDSKLMKEALAVSAQTTTKANLITPLELSNDMKTRVLQQISLALQGKQSAKVALDNAVKFCNDNVAK